MLFANHINTVIKLIVSLWFIDCFSRIYLLALALSILVRKRNWLKPIVVRIENDRNVIEMIYFDAFRWRYTCLLAGSFVWSAFACKLRTQLNRFIEIIIIFVQFYCSMFADYSSFGHIQLFKYEYFTCFKFTNELNFCFSSWNWRQLWNRNCAICSKMSMTSPETRNGADSHERIALHTTFFVTQTHNLYTTKCMPWSLCQRIPWHLRYRVWYILHKFPTANYIH